MRKPLVVRVSTVELVVLDFVLLLGLSFYLSSRNKSRWKRVRGCAYS